MKSAKTCMSQGVSKRERARLAAVSRKVSPRNWSKSWRCELPRVLRMPISFARRAAFAVVRLMKLIQASNSRKAATSMRP